MYGKNNRILYTAKFSQGFKVVAAKRTRQGAGVSNGGTKIRVTGRGNPNGEDVSCGLKARRNQRACGIADAMARQESSLQPAGTQSPNETP